MGRPLWGLLTALKWAEHWLSIDPECLCPFKRVKVDAAKLVCTEVMDATTHVLPSSKAIVLKYKFKGAVTTAAVDRGVTSNVPSEMLHRLSEPMTLTEESSMTTAPVAPDTLDPAMSHELFPAMSTLALLMMITLYACEVNELLSISHEL